MKLTKVRLLISYRYRIHFVTHIYFHHEKKIILKKVPGKPPRNYRTSLKRGEYPTFVKYQTIIRFILWQVQENTSLAALGALAQSMQHLTACKIQNGH